MKVNADIFRAYDIRGKYPQELDEQTVFGIARAFTRFIIRETHKENPFICIGRDARLSSESLFQACSQGLLKEGGRVIDLGRIITPYLYFVVVRGGYDAGVSVTASHNPNPYNGLKLMKEGAFPLSGRYGLPELKRQAGLLADEWQEGGFDPARIESRDMREEYVSDALAWAEGEELSGLRVAVDTGNGMAGPFAERLFEKLPGVKLTKLFFEPDGRFPNHIPDPLVAENMLELSGTLREGDFHCGIAFDGDGDRVVFFDEEGRQVRGDLLAVLLAEKILEKRRGARIGHDIRSSRTLAEHISKKGGVPVMTRVGHSFIKETMRDENLLFASELSGHYYWGEDRFYEVPFFVLFLVLRLLKAAKARMSELVAPLEKGWRHSGELNFQVADKEAVMERLAGMFPGARVSRLDGLRADFPNWWFLARPSNTEPVLRLVVEANTPVLLRQRTEELEQAIHS